MTALLTEHLPLIASATNGVKKLRELILQLAVMGKLVPQDPNDEPASKLLTTIVAKKAKLEALTGKNRVQTKASQKPNVELPQGWLWTTLETIAFVNPRNQFDDNSLASFVPMTLIATEFNGRHSQEQRLWKDIKSGFTHFAEGDIGIAKITPCFENSKACIFSNLTSGIGAGTTELHIIRPIQNTLAPRYILAFLKSPEFLKSGEAVMTGSAGQKRLPKDFLSFTPFPLPPLAEQHRIVAKVDELMALCDVLEAQQTNAVAAHKQLVKTLMDTLIQSKDQADFSNTWGLIKQNFDTLFITEASIDTLKQTLLQLAVMGKLVPQDPNDEPSSIVLLRPRYHLIKETSNIAPRRYPYELPAGWEWVTYPQIGELARGRSKHRPRNDPKLFSKGIYPLIQTGDIARAKYEVRTYSSKYNEDGLAQSRLWPQGTLCITIAANIADTAVLGMNACFPDSIVAFCPFDNAINIRFIWIFMQTAKSKLEDFAPSTAQKNINLQILQELLLPLPPTAEQHRIVAKVDELLTLCDQLKNTLQESRNLEDRVSNGIVDLTINAKQLNTLPQHEKILQKA